MDKLFKIETLRATSNPQQLVWLAAHQDYSPDYVIERLDKVPDEQKSGEHLVRHLLAGDRGHWGPFEHPQISLACGYFPCSVVQQLRTHRIGVSFDVQSFRWTSEQILRVGHGIANVESAFYLRPVGEYCDSEGNKYLYSEEMRHDDSLRCFSEATHYAYKLFRKNYSKEHARDFLPFNYRQHFVLSCNTRSLCHILDLRSKKDAQVECQWFCELLFQEFEEWMPHIAAWYKSNRWGRARLAP